MRFSLAIMLLCLPTLAAQEDKRSIDQAFADALRHMHDRAADLYNEGDPVGGYRMFQGGLIVVRDTLVHHPDLQKTIREGLSNAEGQQTIHKKAFALHELTEKIRTELNTRAKKPAPEKKGEKSPSLTIPPREVKEPEPKMKARVDEVSDGVVGRIIWRGKALSNVDVTFVSLGSQFPRVYRSTTGSEGVYRIGNIEPGKYVVRVVPGPKCEVQVLPERFATYATSPLRMDIRGQGEKLDFVLQ